VLNKGGNAEWHPQVETRATPARSLNSAHALKSNAGVADLFQVQITRELPSCDNAAKIRLTVEALQQCLAGETLDTS
jgi:hypothetical protein